MAKVLFINNEGGGYADEVEVKDDCTIAEFFDEQMEKAKPEDYLIRVNRAPVTPDQKLVDGDRITITPTKVDGSA